MVIRKCKVMFGRDHLATLSVLPDGRWELQPTETHLPVNMIGYVKLFDPYVGSLPPPLVRDWQTFTGAQLDSREPISWLILRTSHVNEGLKFIPEGR